MCDDLLQLQPEDFQKQLENGVVVDEDVVNDLMDRMVTITNEEPNVLELSGPIIVCGDIHGQMYDLFQLFSLSSPIPESRYLFLGDYVDRGYQSLNTFLYLAYLKVKFPDSIYLLRGNHEGRQVNITYGFRKECQRLYGNAGTWEKVNNAFDYLPYAAVINNMYFCVHGGLSPDIKSVEELMLIDRFKDIPDEGPFSDLTWSDPDDCGRLEGYRPNSRGAGHLFGRDVVEQFLRHNNLKYILRAHQLAQEGIKWFYDEQLAIVWSAPNYAYKSGNEAAIMRIDKDGNWSVTKFREDARSDTKPDESSVELLPYFA